MDLDAKTEAIKPLIFRGIGDTDMPTYEQGINEGLEKAAAHCDELAKMNERSSGSELAERGARQLRAIASEIRGLKK
jgi:hypothetical protein